VDSGTTGVDEVLQLAEAHHEALTSALDGLSSKLSEAMMDPYTDKVEKDLMHSDQCFACLSACLPVYSKGTQLAVLECRNIG
jgi:hypothetical protein